MEKKKGNYTTVSIPGPLAENIRKRMQGTGFNSISSYVTYVLRQVLSSMERDEKKPGNPGNSNDVFTENEENVVKERLRALGYLD
jgi:Arc/MetJ-type ribon-helix-helix transcriptional regulator